jgi:hypothetical protein
VRAVGTAFPFDIDGDYPPAAVKSYSIDEWKKWRVNILTANSNQLFLDALGVINTFDA